ncbi:hypothetical protein PFISCL1PPCAC_2018, partial [Pristionchus fissidentatus]
AHYRVVGSVDVHVNSDTMSSDWIHCNSCMCSPSPNVQFTFSSCGHIVCKKCLSKIPNASACPYCKKNAKFMEINRTLKPEMQMFFRNPRDLANEYMKNITSVLDFQHGHRSRFARAQQEKNNKMMKFATAAQGEIKKRIDSEKRAVNECMEFRSENEKLKMHNQKLESLLASRDMEIERLRSAPSYSPTVGARNEYQRSDSGLGDTPMSSLSFIDAITSTPINRSESPSHGYSGRKKSRDRLKQMFQSVNGTIPSPIVRPDQMVTPAMLGINKKRSASENNRRTPNGTNFMFDDNMDIGGGF